MPIAPPLIGTYSAPAVKRGEVVTCLYRDRDCTITTMSTAPIPWPWVQPRGEQGGSGLWVNSDLVRAIKTESAEALKHWFGVSTGVVWKWRKAFGVGGRVHTTEGSKRAIRRAAQKGAVGLKAKVWTAAERRARSRRSKRLGLKLPAHPGAPVDRRGTELVGHRPRRGDRQEDRTERLGGPHATGKANDPRVLRCARWRGGVDT